MTKNQKTEELKKILIVGSGGRENSIAWALSKNQSIEKIYVCPGNGGTANFKKCICLKPKAEDAPTNLAIIGRYILTPDIFDIIRDTPPGKNGEVQITDALLQQAKKGCVMAYKFKGKRFDCGSIEGFIDATNYCYDHVYKK